jgi:hypothetical protein
LLKLPVTGLTGLLIGLGNAGIANYLKSLGILGKKPPTSPASATPTPMSTGEENPIG